MFVVALILVAWRIHYESKGERLVRVLRNAQASRDQALMEWQRASALTGNGTIAATEEQAARRNYFLWRGVIERTLTQIAESEGAPAPPPN
jgi:hypothetical protein